MGTKVSKKKISYLPYIDGPGDEGVHRLGELAGEESDHFINIEAEHQVLIGLEVVGQLCQSLRPEPWYLF